MKNKILNFVPLIVFVLALALPIPIVFLAVFRDYSILLFLFLLTGFLLAIKVKEQYRWTASTTFSTLVFGLALQFKWASGYSDNRLVGGLIPIKDGFFYTTGAENILNGMRLALENYQGAWRPLFPGLLSSLMLLTDQDLAVILAMLVFLVGLAIAFGAHAVYAEFGALPSALFFSLMSIYILPFVGTVSTELAGFLMGTLSLVIFQHAIRQGKMIMLSIAVVILALAVSIRSGTFFVFPLIALWIGYRYRGSQRYSIRHLFFSLALMAGVLLVFNFLYPRIMAPGVSSNGNFAFTIYGQVTGGTGWLQATRDVGRDETAVYRAAFEYFLSQPFDFVRGSLKAYSQFFSPNPRAIFSFDRSNPLDYTIWGASYLLVLSGVVFAIKNSKKPFHLFLLLVLVGFLASIPFLPPIDGGRRFYASTAPYFFVFLSAGLYFWLPKRTSAFQEFRPSIHISVMASVVLFVLTIFVPPMILFVSNPPARSPVACEGGLEPFATTIHRGNYVDLIPDSNQACGYIPDICLADIKAHAFDPYDLFLEEWVASTEKNQTAIRLSPAVNMINRQPALFWLDPQMMTEDWLNQPVTGCANFRNIDNRHVYIVKSLEIMR